MEFAHYKFSELAEPLRLDAEYYVVAKSITKKYNALFNKTYKGQKTTTVSKHFEIKREDIPEAFPVFVIDASSNGKLSYKVIEKCTMNKRHDITVVSKSQHVSVYDLIHFIDHKQVKDYLSLHLQGAIIQRLPTSVLYSLKIPLPKIQLAAKDISNMSGGFEPAPNEFKIFIALYYQQYYHALKNEQLVAAVMLAGAISEAILYQVILDSGVEPSLLDNRGLGGLIRDIKLGRFNEIEGQEFDLEPFSTLNMIRNDIVHPNRAINKLKTDYELINKQTIIDSFNKIKRYFGL